MITPGEVRALREVKEGIQAQVCIAASTEHGSAIVTVVAKSHKVQAAAKALREAVGEETQSMLGMVLADQAKWDVAKANSAPSMPADIRSDLKRSTSLIRAARKSHTMARTPSGAACRGCSWRELESRFEAHIDEAIANALLGEAVA